MQSLRSDLLQGLGSISYGSELVNRFHFVLPAGSTLLKINNLVRAGLTEWNAKIEERVPNPVFWGRYIFTNDPKDSLFSNWNIETVVKQLPVEILVEARCSQDHFYVLIGFERIEDSNHQYKFTLYRERRS